MLKLLQSLHPPHSLGAKRHNTAKRAPCVSISFAIYSALCRMDILALHLVDTRSIFL